MAKWNPQSVHSDLAAFSEDPRVKEELRRRRRRRVLISVILCAIVGFSAKPAYQALRKLQIDRNLEAAKAAARIEDWGNARNKARSVLLARPADFDAYRIWYQALSHMGEPRTYMVAANLFMHPRATREDRLSALGVLARQGPEAVALSAYASLDESMREEPAALAALSPLLVRRGQAVLVEKVLRETSTDDPAIRLELLRALCSVPTAERVGEARTLFAGLLKSGASEPALEALLILGETPGGLAKGPPLPPLPEWVQAQPKATTLHHLIALHPAIDEAAGATDAVIQKAIDRFLGIDPGTLGTWLIRHEKSALAADLLAEPAKSSPTAFIARLHALLREKRTSDVAALLAEPPASCDLVDLELAKAAAARMTGDSAAESNAWNQALNNAAFDQSRNRFLEIGKYSATLGTREIIDDSWVAAIRIGWGPIPLYRDLQPVFASLASKSRSEDLLAICRTLLRFEPQNPELINNFHYLALLHEVIAPADAIKALEDLIAANPEVAEFRSALALAHLMADEPQKALAQLPILKQSKRVSPLMIRALDGTARVLAGETEAGSALLAGINWRAFMRAESLAFRRLLTRLEIQNLPLPPMEQIPPAPDPENAPAWRRAVERLEKERAKDTLPALPMPRIPGTEPANAD
jgi:transposase-like protein